MRLKRARTAWMSFRVIWKTLIGLLNSMEPNKENIRLWVDALRSGNFKQCKGRLRKSNLDSIVEGYCCLGVLGMVFAEHNPDKKCEFRSFGMDFMVDGTAKNEDCVGGGHLPKVVSDWVGLPDDPLLVLNDDQSRATIWNDTGKTFLEIADAIEKRYLA